MSYTSKFAAVVSKSALRQLQPHITLILLNVFLAGSLFGMAIMWCALEIGSNNAQEAASGAKKPQHAQ